MALFSARNCLKKRCGGISDTWQNLAETGFNYLQSRYYNPEIGRFVSADVYLSTGQGVLGHNAYAYCGNNPVARIDSEGELWNIVVGAFIGAVVNAASNIVGQLDAGKFGQVLAYRRVLEPLKEE